MTAIGSSVVAANRHVIGGLLGGLFAPIATWLLGLPLLATLPGAVLTYAGVVVLLRPRRLFEDLDRERYEAGQLALAEEVLKDAHEDLDRLAAAAKTIRNIGVRKRLDHLGGLARRVALEVERDPARLRHVRRLLTYYLPSAARLAAGYVAIEQRVRPDPERINAAQTMLVRLDDVFSDYADRLVTTEIEGLDLEIRLVEEATRET